MEYIIASLVAILAATLIVYKLANNIFGLGLRLKPLLLCAACAMFISLVLPKIVVGFAGLPGTLAVLAIFAVTFAYFVAKYEDEPSPSGFESETETACCLAVEQNQPDIIVQADSVDELLQLDNNSSENEENRQPIETYNEDIKRLLETQSKSDANILLSPIPENVLIDDNNAECNQGINNLIEVVEESPIKDLLDQEESLLSKKPSAQLTTEPDPDLQKMDCSVPLQNSADVFEEQILHKQLVDDQVILPDDCEEGIIEPVAEQPIQLKEVLSEEPPMELFVNEIKQIEEELTEKAMEVSQQMPDEISGQEEVEQESFSGMPEQSFVQEVDRSIMTYNEPAMELVQFESEKLDDLLDFAFMSKESHDYNSAFNAFNRALNLYPNSEAAPFLIVEIGNILKNKGAYDDAIKVFLDGRSLSQTRQDEMMEQEFISTIAYLRITKNILLQNRLGSIPFLEIPPPILEQIDEEFREWRDVGNI